MNKHCSSMVLDYLNPIHYEKINNKYNHSLVLNHKCFQLTIEIAITDLWYQTDKIKLASILANIKNGTLTTVSYKVDHDRYFSDKNVKTFKIYKNSIRYKKILFKDKAFEIIRNWLIDIIQLELDISDLLAPNNSRVNLLST